MTDKPDEITEARLKALSPTEQLVILAAIAIGKCRLVKEPENTHKICSGKNEPKYELP